MNVREVSQKITRWTQLLRRKSNDTKITREISVGKLKQPGWLRDLEVAIGLVVLVSGVLVLVFPGLGVATLVILLSIGLIFAGIRSISLVGHSGLPKGLRAVSATAGIISLILALIVELIAGYGVLSLLILVSYGLIVYGFGRAFLAYRFKETASWFRGLIVVVGVLDIILSAIVLALPGLALLTLAAILALVMLVSGAESLISGTLGRK